MKLSSLLFISLLPAEAVATFAFQRLNPLLRHKQSTQKPTLVEQQQFFNRQTNTSTFLNDNTTKFLVEGTSLPNVSFDIGQSFAGTLPVGDANNGSSMFFWFFPTTSNNATEDIVIWLNGGPGCSSLEGFLQENGPFLWRPGTSEPHPNPWSWNQLSNIVWVEQPIGTGFSTGTVTATSEDDVAEQFMGFWKNFVDAFGIQGYSIYVTGESYAGAYCPYIASNMLDTNDTAYFNVKGMIIYDPVISGGSAGITSTNYFLQYWKNVLPLNETTLNRIQNSSKSCGFDEYSDKYLTFPPSGQQPDVCQTPGITSDCTDYADGCDLLDDAFDAMLYINPGFNIYQVAQLLPLPSDVLGFAASNPYIDPGTQVYFNRSDVKAAIHAPPDVDWLICSEGNVFVAGIDNSDASSYKKIPNVIERTNNVQIAHGTMDMVLLANGTLLAIQNMTWNGQMGFQTLPEDPLFVPHHNNPDMAGTSGQGVLGTWHQERGLTWVLVDLTGHMVPMWQAAVAYRQLQLLLGHVGSLSDTAAFPQYADTPQPSASDLGFGTAPQLGISLNGKTSSNNSKSAGGINKPTKAFLLLSLFVLWL